MYSSPEEKEDIITLVRYEAIKDQLDELRYIKDKIKNNEYASNVVGVSFYQKDENSDSGIVSKENAHIYTSMDTEKTICSFLSLNMLEALEKSIESKEKQLKEVALQASDIVEKYSEELSRYL